MKKTLMQNYHHSLWKKNDCPVNIQISSMSTLAVEQTGKHTNI